MTPLGWCGFSEDLLEITARKDEPSFSDWRSKQPPPDLKNRFIEYITVNLNHLSFSVDFLPPCMKSTLGLGKMSLEFMFLLLSVEYNRIT